MKAVMVMFDSLNRHMLLAYGCEWTHTPNFARLAKHTVTFDRSYVCSMPCMPARYDLHSGRPNFLHRSWGLIEPYSDSVPQILSYSGVHTHLATDHYHYFEEGGANYHTKYDTWQFSRGQEGDPWIGQVAPPQLPPEPAFGRNATLAHTCWQDQINRPYMPTPEDQPQSKTFVDGIDYIRRNHEQDEWFLQIETFDPHEPFFSHDKYKDLYPEHYEKWRADGNVLWDWPDYKSVTEPPELVEHMRYEYASLLSMCDAKLGEVLDVFDELNLWEDTMLIVWTDHGFLLGEHDCWAKCWMPFYNEVANTPFFVWDPRSGKAGERRDALVQPSIDLGPTLLDYFEIEATDDMLGKSLAGAIADETPVRDAAIFGMHGGQVNVTDGRYVYMRGPANEDNQPLNQYTYTLMPVHMVQPSDVDELADNIELAEPFSFTKHCCTMKIGGRMQLFSRDGLKETLLFDVEADPKQQSVLDDPAV